MSELQFVDIKVAEKEKKVILGSFLALKVFSFVANCATAALAQKWLSQQNNWPAKPPFIRRTAKKSTQVVSSHNWRAAGPLDAILRPLAMGVVSLCGSFVPLWGGGGADSQNNKKLDYTRMKPQRTARSLLPIEKRAWIDKTKH